METGWKKENRTYSTGAIRNDTEATPEYLRTELQITVQSRTAKEQSLRAKTLNQAGNIITPLCPAVKNRRWSTCGISTKLTGRSGRFSRFSSDQTRPIHPNEPFHHRVHQHHGSTHPRQIVMDAGVVHLVHPQLVPGRRRRARPVNFFRYVLTWWRPNRPQNFLHAPHPLGTHPQKVEICHFNTHLCFFDSRCDVITHGTKKMENEPASSGRTLSLVGDASWTM